MTVQDEDQDLILVARVINACAFAAANEVYDFAARYDERGDHLPLEELALRVQRRVVEKGAAVAREDADALP